MVMLLAVLMLLALLLIVGSTNKVAPASDSGLLADGVTRSYEHRFRVNSPQRTRGFYVDAGRPRGSAGNYFIEREPLTNESGDRIGRVHSIGLFLRPKGGLAHLEATFVLFGRGKLHVEGLIDYESPGKNHGIQTVTGGTRDFIGAKGSVRTVVPSGRKAIYYFHLKE